MNEYVQLYALCIVSQSGIVKLWQRMNQWVNRRVSGCKQLLPSVFGRIVAFGLFVFCGATVTHAELGMEVIHEVYGDDYETIRQIPGRPWVEVQYRYERDGVMISCNFAAGRCLWIDYWSKGTEIDESYLFNELEHLFRDWIG